MPPLRTTFSKSAFPFQTLLLALLFCGIFFAQVRAADPISFVYRYGLLPASVSVKNFPSLYPFLSAPFLQANWLQLGANVAALCLFGASIERRFKRWYLPFLLLGGMVAVFAQYWIDTGTDLPVLGASGMVAAALGVYFMLVPRATGRVLADLPARILLALWFLIQLFDGVSSVGAPLASAGIAYVAHVAGFLFGVFIASMVSPIAERA